jgi:prophage antirepressor-like protein
METSILQWKENASIRMKMIDDKPWFVAKDVCEILGLIKYRDALSHVDDEDKRVSIVVDTLGGPQSMTAVNESGFYALIFQSRKPQAKAFRKWVTSEVLPSLWKYGYYVAPGAELTKDQREALLAVMIKRMRRYLEQRDVGIVARRTCYPAEYVLRVATGRMPDPSPSVVRALQERALKNKKNYVDPLSEEQMMAMIEQLR